MNGSGVRQLLSFRIGDARLAVAADEVAEVLRRPRLTRVPHAPAGLAGVTNLRGAVAPVVSLARLLGKPETHSADARVILLDRSPPVAFLVDEVTALSAAGAEWDGATLAAGELFLDDDGPRRAIDLNALLDKAFAARGGVVRGRSATTQTEARTPVREIGLMAFELAGQDYALPLEQVREVMAMPAGVAAMPRTDAAMIGAVALRGAVLPLVSARALLGLAERRLRGDERVVVTLIGDAAIGLVVDRLSAILRADESAIGPVPAVLNRGRGEARIEGLYRRPDGRGLVSILNPERLFEDESVAHILADGRQKGDAAMTETMTAAGEQFVIFRLGEEEYGLPIAAVDEIVRLPDSLTRVPHAPGFVEGVMNLRGRVVPVIDQRARFQVDGEAGPSRRRVIVTRIGELQAGFKVDSVSEVLELSAEQLRPTPELAGEDGGVFDRIASLAVGGRMILLVDPKALLDRAEADLLAAMSATDPSGDVSPAP